MIVLRHFPTKQLGQNVHIILYSIIPISGTSSGPKEMVPLSECSTYPKLILPRDDVITLEY